MWKFAGLLSLILTIATPALADWHCQCGTIVHVNYPTTCPVCGRNLPNSTPPFTPPGGGSVNDGTGIEIGVNIYAVNGRVVVQSVLPGTPAQGRLFPNDQLVKGAFRDPQNGQVYKVQIYSPNDVTRLKSLAGAGTKVALEVFRPTTGTRSFFLTFATDGGIVTRTRQVYGANGQVTERTVQEQRAATPMTITEDSTGEAAQWLNEGGGSATGGTPPVIVNPGNNGAGGESAADLLNGPGQ